MGYEAGSRTNVPAVPPGWIVEGLTTRDDVLLRLGTPDAEALDGRWYGYLSSQHEGGVAFVAGAGGGMGAVSVEGFTERRLVVWFDDRAVVSKANAEERKCPRAGVVLSSSQGRTGRCFDFADVGGVAPRPPGIPAAQGQPVVAVFDRVVWSIPFLDHRSLRLPTDFAQYEGSVVVTSGGIHAQGRDTGGHRRRGELRVAFADVTDVSRYRFMGRIHLVIVARGVEYGFDVLAASLDGVAATEQLITAVEAQTGRTAGQR